MKHIFFFFFAVVLTSCMAWGNDMLLKCKDIQFFETHEMETSPLVKLEVSGLAMHSSLAVNNIDTTTIDGCMTVLVHLTPARKGLRGDFKYNIEVPSAVNSVCFGSTECMIWKRGVGSVKVNP